MALFAINQSVIFVSIQQKTSGQFHYSPKLIEIDSSSHNEGATKSIHVPFSKSSDSMLPINARLDQHPT